MSERFSVSITHRLQTVDAIPELEVRRRDMLMQGGNNVAVANNAVAESRGQRDTLAPSSGIWALMALLTRA